MGWINPSRALRLLLKLMYNISLVIQSASFKLVDSDVLDCFMKQWNCR